MRSAVHCALLLTAVAAFSGQDVQSAQAQASGEATAESLVLVQQIYVPADDPDSWPAGDWIPIASNELLRLLDVEHATNPKLAYLEKATYRARLSGAELVRGEFEAVARLRGDVEQFVDLQHPSVVLTDLSWKDGEAAIWGLGAGNRTLLRVEHDRSLLSGNWSLAGRRVLSTVEFDLAVPPSTVSQLELDLPDAYQLEVEGGLISGSQTGPQSGWRRWAVDLGNRSSCLLRATKVAPASRPTKRSLLVSQVAAYSFADDGVRIQADVTIEQIDGEYDRLEFVVPAQMALISVTTGNEIILRQSQELSGRSSVLQVDTRDLTLTRGTRIRIRGKLPLSLGKQQELPRLDLRGGRWVQIRRQVRVVSPMQLRDISSTTSQLISSSVEPDTGAAVEFEDWTPSSHIAALVDLPTPDLSATVLSRVDWDKVDPVMQTVMDCDAQSGAAYSLECDVPDHWEITRVESESEIPVAQWQTSRDTDGGAHRLRIELRNALTPQTHLRLKVTARPTTDCVNGESDMPVVLPSVSGDVDVVVVVIPPVGVQIATAQSTRYRSIDLADLVVERPELGEEFTDAWNGDSLVFRAQNPSREEVLLVEVGEKEGSSEKRKPVVAGYPHSGSLGESDRVAAGADALEEPFWSAMEVSTVVAVGRGQLCRNRATLSIPAGTSPGVLTLRVPAPARLLTAECDFPLRVAGSEVHVEVTPVDNPTPVALVYQLELEHSLVSGQAQIPLPQWPGGVTQIGWRITLPQGYVLSDVTDGTSAKPTSGLTWTQRLLGPLGRSTAGEIFWPLSITSWRSLGGQTIDEAEGGPASTVIRRSLPGTTGVLNLSIWSLPASYQFGWLVLLCSLLLAAWPFQRERLLRPVWALKMSLVGVTAALLSPVMLSIPWGGFVAGNTIGALLPERWRRRETPRTGTSQDTSTMRRLLPLSVSAGVLFVAVVGTSPTCRGWQNSLNARIAAEPSSAVDRDRLEALDVLVPLDLGESKVSQLPQVLYVERSQVGRLLGRTTIIPPEYLVRSAVYEVARLDQGRPTILAHYEVVLLQPETPTQVVLGITRINFSDAGACRLNGEAIPLLPLRDGEGVVLEVPRQAHPQENDATTRIVELELACQPLPPKVVSDTLLDIGLPHVVDTRVALLPDSFAPGEFDVMHQGERARPTTGPRSMTVVGPLGFLAVRRATPDPQMLWLKPLEAISVVEVHPMRLQIATTLSFAVQSQFRRVDSHAVQIQLPRQSIIKSVRSSALRRSRIDRTGNGTIVLDLLFDESAENEIQVDIAFDTPPGDRHASVVSIPAMPLFHGREQRTFPVHRIGVAAAPGFLLQTTQPGSLAGDKEDSNDRQASQIQSISAQRVEATYVLNSAQSIEVPLEPIRPAISATVRQTLTVKESEVQWSATAELGVRDASVAVHPLQIDPRVDVRQASVMQEGAERLASWSRRTPEQLDLMLNENLTGLQTIKLTGVLLVDEASPFLIPQLVVPSATLVEPAEVVVLKDSNVNLVVAAEDGTVVAPVASEITSRSGLRRVTTVNLDPMLPALRIQRTTQPQAYVIEQITSIDTLAAGDVAWTSKVQLHSDSPWPERLELTVSAPLSETEIAATVPIAVSQRGDTIEVSADLREQSPETVELTLRGRTPLATGQLPEVRSDDVSPTRHLVLIPQDIDVNVENATGTIDDPAELPDWIRQRFGSVVDPSTSIVEVTDQRPRLNWTALSDADLQLLQLNSAVWKGADASRSGVTVADVLARHPAEVDFALPDGVVVWLTEANGAQTQQDTRRELSVPLPASASVQRVTLWWIDSGRAVDEIPLPAPSNVQGNQTHAVIFDGHQRTHDVVDSRTETEDALWLERELAREQILREATPWMDSPVVAALLDAGVTADSGQVARQQPSVYVLRLEGHVNRVLISTRDRFLVGVVWILAAAGGLLVAWHLIGEWSERFQLSWTDDCSLLALSTIGVIVWLLGKSWLGLLFCLVVGISWIVTRRRAQIVAADLEPTP